MIESSTGTFYLLPASGWAELRVAYAEEALPRLFWFSPQDLGVALAAHANQEVQVLYEADDSLRQHRWKVRRGLPWDPCASQWERIPKLCGLIAPLAPPLPLWVQSQLLRETPRLPRCWVASCTRLVVDESAYCEEHDHCALPLPPERASRRKESP